MYRKNNLNVNYIYPEIYNSIVKRQTFSLQAHSAERDFIDKVDNSISYIFSYKDYHHLYPPLTFVFKELIENANKANLKRVYFRLNNLNLDHSSEYEQGMEEFTSLLHSQPYSITSYLKSYRKFVKVIFKEYADHQFVAYIVNNSLINTFEKERVMQKFKYYQTIKRNEAKCLDYIDETEGAGMGLFLTLKILEQVGISSSSLSIGVYDGKTVLKIAFKYDEVSPPPYKIVAEEILKELDTLPKYPENIRYLIAKLYDENVEISDIACELSKDPSLSADILKLVNSAKYMLNRKIDSIKEAINLVGLKGLQNLLLSYGAIKIINSRFGSIPEIWDQSYKRAQIASKVAHSMHLAHRADEFFTAGLLADIGKIVLMSFDVEKAKKIERLCRQRGVRLPIMEEIIMGLSSSKIGGKIAEIWEFPENLTSAITYHQEPIMAKTNHEIVNAVHIASHLAKIDSKDQLNMYIFDARIRNFFGINSPKKLFDFVDHLHIL